MSQFLSAIPRIPISVVAAICGYTIYRQPRTAVRFRRRQIMPTSKYHRRSPKSLSTPCLPGALAFEPAAYHDALRAGYVALVTRDETGRSSERIFSLSALAKELKAAIDAHLEAWISVAQFYERTTRSPDYVSRLPVCSLRLAFRTMPGLAGLSPEKIVKRLLARCRAHGIPMPTLIVRSGILEVKWVFRTPAPSSALPRWGAVQKELARTFAKFGADPVAAADVCALFRVVGSKDGETGDPVHIMHCGTEADGAGASMRNGLAVYDFDEFAKAVLPYTRAQVLEWRQGQANRNNAQAAQSEHSRAAAAASDFPSGPAGRPWNRTVRSLVSARLRDLRTIWRLRRWKEGAEAMKQRDSALFFAAVSVAQLVDITQLHDEIAKLTHELAPSFSAEHVERCVGSAIERLHNMTAGRGPGQYRLSTSHIIEKLSVTAEEQQQLLILIDREEKLRRKREREAARRRQRGVPTRAERLAKSAERRKRAKEMSLAGKRWPQVARALGYFTSDAARMDCGRA